MKSYTDLEQSKKLAEILPPETADMYYLYNIAYAIPYEYRTGVVKPCWSLTALLDALPKFIGDYGKCIYYDVSGYYCGYMDDGHFMHTILETKADNQIDACYEMILKLKEKNLL